MCLKQLQGTRSDRIRAEKVRVIGDLGPAGVELSRGTIQTLNNEGKAGVNWIQHEHDLLSLV